MDAVATMQKMGSIMGVCRNKFNPKSSVTCAEVSDMFHRYSKQPSTACNISLKQMER